MNLDKFTRMQIKGILYVWIVMAHKSYGYRQVVSSLLDLSIMRTTLVQKSALRIDKGHQGYFLLFKSWPFLLLVKKKK